MDDCGKNTNCMSWLRLFDSSDPDFAQLLNRVQEGQQTNNDML